VRRHWSERLEASLRVATPERRLDDAFLWSRIAIERAWVQVPGLGRGLVAGLAPSGAGARPGYGWFFDGDALAASRALSLTGDFAGVRAVLRFAAAHQREDGKLMHELVLSARLCRWLEDYPYAYYKGLNNPDFVQALEHYLSLSGDVELARELWPAAERALAFCARCLDEEGRLSNAAAGIAAVEAGPLADRIESEVFLQGAWIGALVAAGKLCQALGLDPSPYRQLEQRARAGFEAFYSPEKGRYGFALLKAGERCDDLTAYLGYPLARGVGEGARAWQSVQALNDPALTSDWGARMFATDSALYDPQHYNHGAVFPYLTNFVTLAHFAHGNALAGMQVLLSQVALWSFGGLGLLEEHLEGARARIPRRGVPHQIFSSAALVESVVLGLFGVEASAAGRKLVLRPSLPPTWSEARLSDLRVGAALLDVRLYRRRGGAETIVGAEVEHKQGPSLQIGFAPVLPPLTRLFDGPGWLRPSGAVVPRRLHRSRGERLALEARVREGPAVQLHAGLPGHDAQSRNARLVRQEVAGESLRWTFAGPAGTRTELCFTCDLEHTVAGAVLEQGLLRLSFPPGPAGSWTTTEVEVTTR
jgi:glycogen debranching enzyme